ncbi:hypothetical protein, partial [Burkholderia vietnamiensis]|uniref:hypothetical protein n=1 Tax=Burkholderia vietnamiensis TaxID=60552 RepID=UPI001E5F8EDD
APAGQPVRAGDAPVTVLLSTRNDMEPSRIVSKFANILITRFATTSGTSVDVRVALAIFKLA